MPRAQLEYAVSHFAIARVAEKAVAVQNAMRHRQQLEPCTGAFRRVMGLPCSHDMRDAFLGQRPIALEQIHQQWQLAGIPGAPRAVPPPRPVRDPPLPRLGRARVGGIGRELLHHEHVERRIRQRQPSRCSVCRSLDHKAPRCPQARQQQRPGQQPQ